MRGPSPSLGFPDPGWNEASAAEVEPGSQPEHHGALVMGVAQAQLLVGLITTGGVDEHLGMIQAAISRRHRERAGDASRQMAARLTIGDRVRVSKDMRPIHLQGATGTVVGWASKNVVVQLDDRSGRSGISRIRCPPLGLERLPS